MPRGRPTGFRSRPTTRRPRCLRVRSKRERGYFAAVDHPETGALEYAGAPFQLDGTPTVLTRAPLLGEHNATVYGGLLGYSPAELTALARAGAI